MIGPSSSTEARARLPTSASSIAWSSCRMAWSSASRPSGADRERLERGAERLDALQGLAHGLRGRGRGAAHLGHAREERRRLLAGRRRARRPGAGGRPRSAPGPRARSSPRPPASRARPCRSPGAASDAAWCPPVLFLERRAGADRLGGGQPQVPRHAVEALLRLPLDAAHDVAGRVLHRQHDHGLRLAALRLDLRPAGVGRVLPRLDERLLLLLPRLLPAPDVVGQVVGEDRAEGRVRRREVRVALRRLAALPERLALDVPPGLAHREERRPPSPAPPP